MDSSSSTFSFQQGSGNPAFKSRRSVSPEPFKTREHHKIECNESKHEPISDDDSCDLKSAQLTIFYAGMVHVYDHVPADKAHAIMLLAGGGNSGFPQIMNSRFKPLPAETSAARSTRPTRDLTAAMESRTPAPSSSTLSAAERKQQRVPRSPAELPFARKASLARFLEKRTNRVQAKAIASPGENAISREDDHKKLVGEQPNYPKKLCLRLSSSLSPSSTMPVCH